jgi:hypothetical protein
MVADSKSIATTTVAITLKRLSTNFNRSARSHQRLDEAEYLNFEWH